MSVTYQVEPFARFYADAKDMIAAHWKEAATFSDVRTLAIDEQKFIFADERGILILITAREWGALVGYIIGHVIAPHHATGSKTAEQAYYYVAPEYRGRGVFADLCEAFEKEAKSRGAVDCGARQKVSGEGAATPPDAFFEKMGYEKTEVVWKKRA